LSGVFGSGFLPAPLRHMAFGAIAGPGVLTGGDQRVDSGMALPASRVVVGHRLGAAWHAVRVVTALTGKLPRALQKTLRLPQTVHRTHGLELVIMTSPLRMVESEHVGIERLARLV
jgi:hypothetical protein